MLILQCQNRPAGMMQKDWSELEKWWHLIKAKTGRQIKAMMKMRHVTVEDVRSGLSLGCVQSVYHWMDGKSMPTIDNLYALSGLLQVPMDMLVVGNRRYHPKQEYNAGAERLLRYYRLLQDCMAA